MAMMKKLAAQLRMTGNSPINAMTSAVSFDSPARLGTLISSTSSVMTMANTPSLNASMRLLGMLRLPGPSLTRGRRAANPPGRLAQRERHADADQQQRDADDLGESRPLLEPEPRESKGEDQLDQAQRAHIGDELDGHG